MHGIGDDELSNIVESSGAGCVFFDFDDDGDLDIYLVNGSYLEGVSSVRGRGLAGKLKNALYRNNGGATFTDVTDTAGVGDTGFGMAAVAADYDNDGDRDLFVTNYGRDTLYRNNGDGSFTDVTTAAGVGSELWSIGASFFDADGDGLLDLYVGGYLIYDPEYSYYFAAEAFPGPLAYRGQKDILYHNNGDGTFTDIGRAAGVGTSDGRAMGVSAGDIDDDGDQDVFVANDGMENYLYRNRGDGSFDNIALRAGTAFGENGEATSAMGPEFGDFDGDGLVDLLVPDMRYGCLYRNLGDGVFEERSAEAGLAAVLGQYTSWSGNFFDYDNDGVLDIFIVNGDAHHLEPEEDTLFRGGGGRFVDVSSASGAALEVKGMGRGSAVGDVDNDGDLDLLVLNLNGPGAAAPQRRRQPWQLDHDSHRRHGEQPRRNRRPHPRDGGWRRPAPRSAVELRLPQPERPEGPLRARLGKDRGPDRNPLAERARLDDREDRGQPDPHRERTGGEGAVMRRALMTVLVLLTAFGAETTEPVFVGAEVCGECHDSAQRDQLDIWYRSPHARAYAALAMPEAAEIARISGLDEPPFSSAVCLGCHATAADVEAWQLDPTFHIEDGVQCERCHGPGGGYIAARVMFDPEAAAAAGLLKPDRRTCMVCHKEKGSHTAVLEVKPFDYDEALKKIAHRGVGGELRDGAARVEPADDDPHVVGVMVCGSCHHGESMGFVTSKWRLTAHAEAYAILGTDDAREIAATTGIDGDPRQSITCLQCHTTGGGLSPTRGVQCESCHGPGSRHAATAGTGESEAAHEVGLERPTRATCEQCHTPGIHGKTFEFESFLPQVDHSRQDVAAARIAAVEYKTPFNLAVSPDGTLLYVVCEASDSLAVVDTSKRAVVGEIGVGNLPHGVCAVARRRHRLCQQPRRRHGVGDRSGGDGRGGDHRGRRRAARRGHRRRRPDALRGQRRLRRCVGGGSRERARGQAIVGGPRHLGREPLARRRLDLRHQQPLPLRALPHAVAIRGHRHRHRAPVVDDRLMIPEANLVQGVDVAPSGDFALVTLIRTKNLVPMTRVLQGWVMTNGIGILWRDGRVDQLLLDEPDDYFADPTDVRITPDGRLAFVTGGGVDEVAVVDLERMRAVLEAADEERRRELLPNHLGVTTEFVERRIPVGRNPRGLAVSPDGRFVYVAEALDDSVAVIDVALRRKLATIDLGGPEEITLTRKGERIFHSAEITYGREFSCHSCHPDGGVDAVTYDIEPDGIGLNPVDNRTLRGILDTAPFKWTGKNPTISRQCGPRLAVFFTRIDPFTPDQVVALESYIRTIPRNPNRYRTGRRAQPGPAPRQGDLRTHRHQLRSDDPGRATLQRLPPSALLHQPGAGVGGHRVGARHPRCLRHPAPQQHLRVGALPPRRPGRHPRGDLDAFQSARRARRDQRHDQGSAQ